jgi:hypothetical protein
VLAKHIAIGLCLQAAMLFAQEGERVDVGRLGTSAAVWFVRDAGGEWGIEIGGAAAPLIRQPKPARLEVFRTEDDIRQLAAGYRTIEKSTTGFDARAEIAREGVVFRVRDRWTLSGSAFGSPLLQFGSRRILEVGNARGDESNRDRRG